ncbi:MAG TPA: hypothetical protein DCP25_08425 [Chloroflexi bacterium]|nr:hypothetical protein [Chloroflexota bacterium]
MVFAVACAQVAPPYPSPNITGAQPVAQLQILSKGGPAVSVRINGDEAARVPCNGGVALKPADQGVPALRWNLQVVDQTGGRILLDERVTQLPRWLLVQRDSAALSTSPILGLFVACSPP